MKIPRFFSKRYRNLRFRTKILCIIGFVALIPSLLVFVLFYNRYLFLHEQRIESVDRSFSLQADHLAQQMESIESDMLRIGGNVEIERFFSSTSDRKDSVMEYVRSIRPLFNYLYSDPNSHVKAIRFFTRNPNLFSNRQIQNVNVSQDTAFFEEISRLLSEMPAAVRLSREDRIYEGTVYAKAGSLSIFVPVLSPDSAKTFLECELSFAETGRTLGKEADGGDAGYSLYHNSGNILFSTDEAFANAFWPRLAGRGDASEGVLTFAYGGRDYRVNFRDIPAIDSVLIGYSDLGAVLSPLFTSILQGILVMGIFGVAGFLLAVTLVNGLLRRADAINAAIRHIQEGDFDVSVPVDGEDFLDQIAANLNAMAARIKDLIRNNYEKQLQIKNLQIRILSQQISPHFLYNTLEGLKMNAVLQGQDDIARALTSLGRLLRYYSNNGSDFSTVGEELKAVRDYVAIMNLIEEKNCVYEEEVPEECLGLSVPRFILQPVVENAIKHADRGGADVLHIRLTARVEGDRMRITVSDDGVGIPPEKLQEIRRGLENGTISYQYGNQPSSIGLYNTNARIKLIYGEPYGIFIESLPGEGSRVSLTISVRQDGGKGETYVSSPDL